MTYHLKCKYCHKPLNASNSIFIRIARYDAFGRRVKKQVFCLNCWDRVKILIDERCEDCKHAGDNPASYPCRCCGHCYISHFEEELS